MEKEQVVKHYPKDDNAVVWKAGLCKHAAKCVGGLPKVFKPKEQPWIQTEHATLEEIMETVARCPSGALSMKKDSTA